MPRVYLRMPLASERTREVLSRFQLRVLRGSLSKVNRKSLLEVTVRNGVVFLVTPSAVIAHGYHLRRQGADTYEINHTATSAWISDALDLGVEHGLLDSSDLVRLKEEQVVIRERDLRSSIRDEVSYTLRQLGVPEGNSTINKILSLVDELCVYQTPEKPE